MLGDRWRAIAARIDGIAAAGSLYGAMRVNSSDTYALLKALGRDCETTFDALLELAKDLSARLPSSVTARLEEFDEKHGTLIRNAKSDSSGEPARTAIALLVALKAELAFLIFDQQEVIRSRTERAFLHLKALLLSDDTSRTTWAQAFARGETSCERLGGVHLLWHGIYAFKADGTRGRTDLVFPEPLELEDVARAVEGMVLTEWKIARDCASGDAKFTEARTQADTYGSTTLAGAELARTRFLVVVSERPLPSVPDDLVEGGVTYRHINIAIEPLTASVVARRG